MAECGAEAARGEIFGNLESEYVASYLAARDRQPCPAVGGSC